jgi:hypothetical protein
MTGKSRQRSDKFFGEIFGPEFLAEAAVEYRRAEIVGHDYDRAWIDERLPSWKFYRASGGGMFVGVNNTLGLTVQGDTESAVQETAAEAQQLAGADREK